jgi:hypothetical protein
VPRLTHLRTQETFSGSVSLTAEQGELSTFPGEGKGRQHEPDIEPLSQIVQILNERFGMELGEADQLLFDQYEREWLDDPELAAQARENTKENFALVFERKFIDTMVQRRDSNEETFKRVLDDEDFRAALADFYLTQVYGRLRDTGCAGRDTRTAPQAAHVTARFKSFPLSQPPGPPRPNLNLWSEPQPDTAFAENDDGARHIRVLGLIAAN